MHTNNYQKLEATLTGNSYHYFTVLLLVKVLVTEHVTGAHNCQFSTTLYFFKTERDTMSHIYSQHLRSIVRLFVCLLSQSPASYLGFVESQNRSVERETDRASGKHSHSRFHYIQCSSIWVDKGKGPVGKTVVCHYRADPARD